MIRVDKTDKYNIEPKKIISSAFDSAYEKTQVTIPVAPPDNITTVFSIISMILLIGLFIVTAYFEKDPIWYTFSALGFGIILYIISKYLKSVKTYKLSDKKIDLKDEKRSSFLALFNYEDLPDVMMANELQRKVSYLLGKQIDITNATALRSINENLSKKNNPNDIMCKLMTPFGSVFTQSKRRLYMKVDGDNICFFDTDFMNPIGEINCNTDNIVSFGQFSKYPAKINPPGAGKVRPESIILEIKDDANSIHFEFQSEDYDILRKTAGSKKELK